MRPTDPRATAREFLSMCADRGFALAGITKARPTDREREIRSWIDSGKHATMAWMQEQLEERLDIERVLPGARTVLMVADLYAARGEEPTVTQPGFGKIARYARGRDYHRVMKRRLHAIADELRRRYPGAHTRTFVDSAPVMEREHALRAGMGWVGKHTLIIHPRLGSWFLLGGIATSLEMEPPEEQRVIEDACGTCTRCIDACPTGAITPYQMDASRCISYLTIERVQTIDLSLHAGVGDWLYGCDVCQDVCPHNSPRAWVGEEILPKVRPEYASERTGLELAAVIEWDEAARQTAFLNSPMKRADLCQMIRNAIIAAGNAISRGDLPEALRLRLLEGVRARAADGLPPGTTEDPGWSMVRETALATLARVGQIGGR